MRGAASNAIACTLMPSLSSIFFILWICVDSASILANSHRTGTIRLESSRISWIRLYRPTTEMAEIGRNRLWMRSKRPRSILPQFYSKYLLLLLCVCVCVCFCVSCFLLSLFYESRHSNVFFKNILIVKIYINKNIFNNFLIATPCCIRTLLFQKLPSPALAPKSGNALVFYRFLIGFRI